MCMHFMTVIIIFVSYQDSIIIVHFFQRQVWCDNYLTLIYIPDFLVVVDIVLLVVVAVVELLEDVALDIDVVPNLDL